MRTNLEPIIDSLFEEDELFAQDFDQDGLNRVLFIRKMGIYVEIKTKDYIPGVVCTPLFHCTRCKDHWIEFGTVPENCQFARQPTRGPPIHLARNRKPRYDARKRKTKRRLGDIKEGFIVTGSGTVLNQIDENDYEITLQNSSSPQSHSNADKAHSTLMDVSSRDSLAFDEATLENLNLREVDSTMIIEAFKEVADAQTLDRETYVKTVAEALGFNEDQYNEFARVNNKTLDKSGDKTFDKSGDKTFDKSDDKTLDKSGDKTLDKSGDKTLDKSGDRTLDKSGDKTLFEGGDVCSYLKTPTSSKTTIGRGETTTSINGKSSVRSILNLSMLDSMIVKDLPERIRAKLISLLRLQRKKRQKQATFNAKRNPHTVDSDNETSESYDNLMDKEMHSEDKTDGTKDSAVKINRKRRDSRVKQGGVRRQSIGDVIDSDDIHGGMSGIFRASSASGRRHSMTSSADSDEEGFSLSRSPSDVLAYKELQRQRRSRKMTPSVKNRTGQPDTPFQRVGPHSFSVPSNSSSFYSYNDGDSDEENWARGRAPRVGSSRAHMSDSGTSYMSDMARGPHESDSRTSMIPKYSRAMGSARSRKDVSFSNDKMSHGSLGNDDSNDDDYDDGGTGTKSNKARRQIKKKEKGDNVRRPRNYHSKVITLGQGSPSMSRVTASFGDANTMYGSNARLSQARISLTEASSALSCDSTVMNKRSVRSVSSVAVKEPSHKRRETPELQQECDKSKAVENRSESFDELPPLEAAVPEDTITTPPEQAQAQKTQSEPKEKTERLFKRVEKTKPLISLEDLNFIHRLPVSSAFTYSFYELPKQHREHNETIKKAAARIGRRKKIESGHFRSRSAP